MNDALKAHGDVCSIRALCGGRPAGPVWRDIPNPAAAPKPELRLEHHLGFPHTAFRQSNTMTLRATSPAASAS